MTQNRYLKRPRGDVWGVMIISLRLLKCGVWGRGAADVAPPACSSRSRAWTCACGWCSTGGALDPALYICVVRVPHAYHEHHPARPHSNPIQLQLQD